MIDIQFCSADEINSLPERQLKKPDISATVAEIIENVKNDGDKALLDYTERFDGVRPCPVEVGKEELDACFEEAGGEFTETVKRCAENIREYHRRQCREGFRFEKPDGVVLGQRIMPLNRVGLYIPGGTASYPSSVLMNCIPAKLAGVKEIIMVTPPQKDGKINPKILAAAKIAGVDRIFKAGGAQAVAALAYGTESVPAVDKIVGPGNSFVAEAKRQVFGKVAIDMIAGPSEILVVSDGKSNPAFVAADMLSQAEHDKLSSAILVTVSEDEAKAVASEIEKQLLLLPRREIAEKSISDYGRIFVTDSLESAVEISNALAPEHLELCTENPFDLLDLVTNAGSVFLGRYCPEALGDYYAGTNHTLPTSGTARFSSPLSVDDFIKKSSYTYYTEDALCKAASDIDGFAKSEGLLAHARSVTIRFDGENGK